MELIKNFANLSKTLSAKYPELEEVIPLYLLAFIVYNYNEGHLYSFVFNGLINPRIVQEIAKLNSVKINKLAKDEFKELCNYLIEACLDIAKNNSYRRGNFFDLLNDLAEREPDAVRIDQKTQKSFDDVIAHVKDGNLIIPLTDSYNAVITPSKFSNIGYKNYAEMWILEALRIGKQDLFTPKSLIELLVKLANPQQGRRIFNPSCGIGSTFVEFKEQFPTYNFDFTGFVSNPFIQLLCESNLLANDVDAFISLDNPLDYSSLDDIYFEEDAKANMDIAVAILPFRMRVSQEELDPIFFKDSNKLNRAEYAFVELMLSTLNNKGRAVIVVTENFLFSKQGKDFREKFLANDWVEKVISLPQETFNPHFFIKTSVIVFNKSKSEKGLITFDGKDDKFDEVRINAKEILATNNVDLRASRYALKESKEVESILSKYPKNEIRKIKDLIVSSISGFNYSPNNRIVENSSETLPYVRVKDLSNDNKNLTLDISKVERKISPEKAHKRTIIDFSAVLVSKIAPKLKPTYFNFTGQPIVIGSDVVALKVKKDVNTDYFLTQLYSRLVQIQVEMMSSGATINRISIQDFLNIQIILPSPEEQQREILEMRGVIAEKLTAEEKVIDAQYEVVANINHSLKNKLAVIINDYDALVRFLRRKERNNGTIRFDDAISANAVGDDIDTIEIITHRLKTNLLDASKVFKNAEKIQKQTLKKDVVELVDFFNDEVKPLYIGKNYSIDIIAKPNLKLNVWLDKDAFKDVVENLIENAKSHGFIDEEKTYRIVFELSELTDSDNVDEKTSTKYARIIYKNDGKPFPKNFSFEDYKQFSNKAGKTQGTGIGGYVINKMIDLHDGRFNFISPSDDFTVEFEILLPLEN